MRGLARLQSLRDVGVNSSAALVLRPFIVPWLWQRKARTPVDLSSTSCLVPVPGCRVPLQDLSSVCTLVTLVVKQRRTVQFHGGSPSFETHKD